MEYLKSLFGNSYNKENFFLIAGPCVVENEEMPLEIATILKGICQKLSIPFIFKASYRKANRSSLHSFSGIGDTKALKAIAKVKEQLSVPVLTDVHSVEDVQMAAPFVDILQIPAFLCRQTDILLAAARTDKIVNVKKGQFVAPEAMRFVAEKIYSTGNKRLMLTERGTMFGYQDLLVDFRSVQLMKDNNCPLVIDITHSVQQPNQSNGISGGRRDLIITIAKAGVAVGFDGVFMETHPNVAEAKSDATNMLPLQEVEPLLEQLVRIRKAIL